MKVGDLVAIKPKYRWHNDPFYIGVIVSVSTDEHTGYSNGLLFVAFADGVVCDFWPEELEVISESR